MSSVSASTQISTIYTNEIEYNPLFKKNKRFVDKLIDLNVDPLFIHKYPGSRVLELALPEEKLTLSEANAILNHHEVDNREAARAMFESKVRIFFFSFGCYFI